MMFVWCPPWGGEMEEEDFFYTLWMVELEFRWRKKKVGVQISLEKKIINLAVFLLSFGN